jgi:hypothetical protein
LTHADAAPPHLLSHGSCRYSAALPPSRCSWLCALSLPSAPSLPPLAASISDPHLNQPPPPPQMTQAAPDLVGMSEEVAAWPLPIVFLCFWLGVKDALLPASALSPRRRLGDALKNTMANTGIKQNFESHCKSVC